MLTKIQEKLMLGEPMGALQPGIPSPSMIPQSWKIKIIDLKDCFYTIPLQNLMLPIWHTVPSINNKKKKKTVSQ